MTDVWLHGASAGDVRALHPLITALRTARPTLALRLTCLTRTGEAMAEHLGLACTRIAPPIGPLIQRAMTRHRPRLLIWEYLELWPAWVRAARRTNSRMLVVDGRVTRRSLRVRPLLSGAAARLDGFCARTEPDAEHARQLGVPADRVHVCGNGKYDALIEPPRPDPALQDAVGPIDVVVGSLHPDEEAAALQAFAQTGLRVLFAPRYPKRVPHLLRRARHLHVSARASRAPGATRWVMLETMGELAAAYALAPVAIVGGTFGKRNGQTLIEPAAQGRPVIHGPRIAHVREEAECLRDRGAYPVTDWTTAVQRAHHLLTTNGPDPRHALPALKGATDRHVAHALRLLDHG